MHLTKKKREIKKKHGDDTSEPNREIKKHQIFFFSYPKFYTSKYSTIIKIRVKSLMQKIK